MIVFLDTEFTDLVVEPRLLSVGMVTDALYGPELYAEVTDRDRLTTSSRFARAVVLPQFGRVDQAACTSAELGPRLANFFESLTDTLAQGEFVEIAFGYHLDWDLVDLAVLDSRDAHWEATKGWLHPVNVCELTGFDEGERAAEAYYKTQANAAFSQHHALCDARALRLAYQSVTDNAKPTPLSEQAARSTGRLRAGTQARRRDPPATASPA